MMSSLMLFCFSSGSCSVCSPSLPPSLSPFLPLIYAGARLHTRERARTQYLLGQCPWQEGALRDNTDIVHIERFWYTSFDFLVSVHTHARAFMHAGTRMHTRMHARMLCCTSDTKLRCRLSDILTVHFTRVRFSAWINAQMRAEMVLCICVCVFGVRVCVCVCSVRMCLRFTKSSNPKESFGGNGTSLWHCARLLLEFRGCQRIKTST